MDYTLPAIFIAVLLAIIGFGIKYYGPGVLTHRQKRLALNVEVDPVEIWGDAPNWDPYACVVDTPIDDVGPPPSSRCRDWWAWAQSIGGVDAFDTVVRVTMVGRSKPTVVVKQLTLNVYQRESALRGSALLCRTGGADMTPRGVNIDLEEETVTFTDADGQAVRKPLEFSVREGEPEQFQIRAQADQSYVEWDYDLTFFVDGRKQHHRIAPSSGSFSTTGLSNASKYESDGSEWRTVDLQGAMTACVHGQHGLNACEELPFHQRGRGRNPTMMYPPLSPRAGYGGPGEPSWMVSGVA